MLRSADLLDVYVRGLRSLIGAESVTLYAPPTQGAFAKAALSHDGDLPPLPELQDPESAESFRRQIAAKLSELRHASPGLGAIEAASRERDGRIIGLLGRAARFPDRRQRGPDADDAPGHAPLAELPGEELWLGLRFRADHRPSARLDPLPLGTEAWAPRPLGVNWTWLLEFAAVLARHSHYVSEILDDPVTELPGRAEFQAGLEHALDSARREKQPLALLMVNPDDFADLNERISREAADAVVREIAERLRAAHRRSDLVARYGSVVFASILPGTDSAEGVRRATEILARLHETDYLQGSVRLRFSLGLACREAVDDTLRRGLDLTRRANLALAAAKRTGGGRLRTWRPGAEEEVAYQDRLLGIFTGQMAKDYRNMALLSDTVSVVAARAGFHELAAQVVRGLGATMKPERVGLFEWRDESGPQLVFGLSRRGEPTAAAQLVESLTLRDEERGLLEAARARRRTVEALAEGGDALTVAVPLLAGRDFLGALCLAGRLKSTSFDSSDVVFLEALATQVAVALDRARLAEQQRRREEQERGLLMAEVEELRTTLCRTQLQYRSRAMEALVTQVRRVAPTEATVLITGESGTGKELIARLIHELSARRERPFVVVDCAAIPTTLLESELFGHEKGAFTGAQQRRVGRLLQAAGGTLLLDEIGELPLEAQSRLLRFVQEKHVTPVGGGSARPVDVRVIAATNRDLAAEAEAGRFRADLYHRLNVVRLEIPPLRARPDDVLQLVDHFREAYAATHGKSPLLLSADARAAVLEHAWPGNVRELQNRVMRAVILCQGPDLTPADFGLGAGEASGEVSGAASEALAGLRPREHASGGRQRKAGPSAEDSSAAAVWAGLHQALGEQVQIALDSGEKRPPPLGRWLAEDLVLEADSAAGRVASRAASLLGMPETTFRRRLELSAGHGAPGWPLRPSAWSAVRSWLGRLVRCRELRGRPLPKRAEQVLLEEILARTPDDPRRGAALLGVTLPTFRRRTAPAARPLHPGPGRVRQ